MPTLLAGSGTGFEEEVGNWMQDSHGRSGRQFPDRGETMYLNTVRPKDVPVGPQRFLKEDAQALRTHDIHGAKPTYKHNRLFPDGKPEQEEVRGSRPKRHFVEPNREIDLALRTFDIERAQPNAAQFKTSRVVNPLTPRYDLPSFRECPSTPPRPVVHEGEFRDTLKFKGDTQTRFLERDYSRNPNESRDIEFSQPNIRQRLKNAPPREVLKTVEKAGERIISTKCHGTPRETNPLDPVYNVQTRTTHPFRRSEAETGFAPREHGRVHGSTPRQLHVDNGEPQASLIRSDIAGAVPQRYKGCMPFSMYDPPEVTPFSGGMQLDCADIDGTQAGTRKPGGS